MLDAEGQSTCLTDIQTGCQLSDRLHWQDCDRPNPDRTGQLSSIWPFSSSEYFIADRLGNDDLTEEPVEKLKSICERQPDQSVCIGDDECFLHSWIASMS